MPGKNHLVYESDSVAVTKGLGRQVGRYAEPQTVVALIGPLGAGKTQFVKGIAAGLGIDDDRKVTSPTFVIVREHAGRLRLYHVDAYRVSSPELSAIGFQEICTAVGVVAIEWADRIPDILPEDHLAITIEPTGAERRRLAYHAVGQRSQRLVDHLAATGG